MNSFSRLLIEDELDQAQVLLASVAHELRTPLSTLSNAAALLVRVVGSDSIGVAALEMIQRQTRVLTRLVGDLVDTARIETGRLSATFEPLDLRDTLQSATSTCRPGMEARGHRFQVLLSDRPLPVFGDGDRLVQVFVNLLDNAIKYTARGGTISVIATTEGRQAVVRVTDTGVGMSGSKIPRLFGMFCQDPSTKSMANGGIGIGLALARSIVVMHKGTVLAQSDGEGKGSEFTVRLPLHSSAVEQVLEVEPLDYGVSLATTGSAIDPRALAPCLACHS